MNEVIDAFMKRPDFEENVIRYHVERVTRGNPKPCGYLKMRRMAPLEAQAKAVSRKGHLKRRFPANGKWVDYGVSGVEKPPGRGARP